MPPCPAPLRPLACRRAARRAGVVVLLVATAVNAAAAAAPRAGVVVSRMATAAGGAARPPAVADDPGVVDDAAAAGNRIVNPTFAAGRDGWVVSGESAEPVALAGGGTAMRLQPAALGAQVALYQRVAALPPGHYAVAIATRARGALALNGLAVYDGSWTLLAADWQVPGDGDGRTVGLELDLDAEHDVLWVAYFVRSAAPGAAAWVTDVSLRRDPGPGGRALGGGGRPAAAPPGGPSPGHADAPGQRRRPGDAAGR